jgi:hypothetical protein
MVTVRIAKESYFYICGFRRTKSTRIAMRGNDLSRLAKFLCSYEEERYTSAAILIYLIPYLYDGG